MASRWSGETRRKVTKWPPCMGVQKSSTFIRGKTSSRSTGWHCTASFYCSGVQMGSVLSFLYEQCIPLSSDQRANLVLERHFRQQSDYGRRIGNERLGYRDEVFRILDNYPLSDVEELLYFHQLWVSDIQEYLQGLTQDRPDFSQPSMLHFRSFV